MGILKFLGEKIINKKDDKKSSGILPPQNTIIVGDCIPIMRTWEPKSIDLILSDPQYPVPGVRIENPARIGLEAEMLRVAKTVVVIMSPASYTLNKTVRDFSGLEHKAIIRCEIGKAHRDFVILAAGEALAGLPGGLLTSKVKCAPYSGQRHLINHPHALPQELINILLAWFSKQGHTACDPFCGSGIVVSLAKEMGRKWLGIEIDPIYGEPLRSLMSGVIVRSSVVRGQDLTKVTLNGNKFGNAFVFDGAN